MTRTYDDEDPALFNPEVVFELRWTAELTDPTHGDATAEVITLLTMKDACIENEVTCTNTPDASLGAVDFTY